MEEDVMVKELQEILKAVGRYKTEVISSTAKISQGAHLSGPLGSPQSTVITQRLI